MNEQQSDIITNGPCPCGTGNTYTLCCEKAHESLPLGSGSDTCEQLMRARYSAYVLGMADYLVATTHPVSREKGLKESILRSMENTEWLGLTINRVQQGVATDKVGKVEFIARLKEHRKSGKVVEGSVHELSRFGRYEDNWVYVDGELY